MTLEFNTAVEIINESIQGVRQDLRDLRSDVHARLSAIEELGRQNADRIGQYEHIANSMRYVLPVVTLGTTIIASTIGVWTWYQTYFGHAR